MFYNNFFHKNIVGESKAPCLFQKEKRGSAKSYFLKVLFPGIEKIANLCLQNRQLQQLGYLERTEDGGSFVRGWFAIFHKLS